MIALNTGTVEQVNRDKVSKLADKVGMRFVILINKAIWLVRTINHGKLNKMQEKLKHLAGAMDPEESSVSTLLGGYWTPERSLCILGLIDPGGQ